jgi:hypothetical protein
MQAQFLTWFDEMKGQLSEDAAGHLQLEIDGLDARLVQTTNTANDAQFDAISNRGNIANTEFSPVTADIAKGEVFQYQADPNTLRYLWRAAVDLPTGTTLVPNSNIIQTNLGEELNSMSRNLIDYVDVSATIGDQQYGTFYYVNVGIPTVAQGKYISATVIEQQANRFASVQAVNNTTVRVYCDAPQTTVKIRIAYRRA